jgi:hypothetical protein
MSTGENVINLCEKNFTDKELKFLDYYNRLDTKSRTDLVHDMSQLANGTFDNTKYQEWY